MGNDLNVGDIIPANGNGNVEEELEIAKNVANMKLDTLVSHDSSLHSRKNFVEFDRMMN